MTELPMSAYPRCIVCGEPVTTKARALWEIEGYERERAQGGTNHVIQRKRTGRMVGSCCAPKVERGDVGQGDLF